MCGLFLINSIADLLVFYRVPIPHHIQVDIIIHHILVDTTPYRLVTYHTIILMTDDVHDDTFKGWWIDDDPPVSHCSSGLLGGELPLHQSHPWSVKWLHMENYHFLDWSSMMIMKNVQECLQCLSRLTAFYIFHLTLLWSSSLLRSLFIFIHNFTHFAVGVFLVVVNIFFFVVFVVINLPLLLSWGLLPKYSSLSLLLLFSSVVAIITLFQNVSHIPLFSLIDVKEHDISFLSLSLSHNNDCNDDQAVLPRVWLLPALRNLAICLHGDNFTLCFTTMIMIMMASTSPSLTLSWSIGHDDGTDFTKITLSSLFSDLCHINITSTSIISMIFTWSWSGSWLMQSAFILYGDQVGDLSIFSLSLFVSTILRETFSISLHNIIKPKVGSSNWEEFLSTFTFSFI